MAGVNGVELWMSIEVGGGLCQPNGSGADRTFRIFPRLQRRTQPLVSRTFQVTLTNPPFGTDTVSVPEIRCSCL